MADEKVNRGDGGAAGGKPNGGAGTAGVSPTPLRVQINTQNQAAVRINLMRTIQEAFARGCTLADVIGALAFVQAAVCDNMRDGLEEAAQQQIQVAPAGLAERFKR